MLPEAVHSQVLAIAGRWNSAGFVPLAEHTQAVKDAAATDPTAVKPVVDILVKLLNRGSIDPGHVIGCLNLLSELAKVAEYLRHEISVQIDHQLVDYYASHLNDGIRKWGSRLAEVLKIERPRHYFDLARRILTANGCLFIVGAGFSYDAYAPLLREMEGVACSTLHDIGIERPRDLYSTDDAEAWRRIGETDIGWQTFQQHASVMLLPKEPVSQHHAIARLFHDGLIRHIIPFNWDDLFEKAYVTQYGEDIPRITDSATDSDHALWKLHGDVLDPDVRWVLPYEQGHVPDTLRRLVGRSSLPGIVIGYREQEPIVVEALISVIEQRGGITRIRPDIDERPTDSFRDNASSAMKKLDAALQTAQTIGEYQ